MELRQTPVKSSLKQHFFKDDVQDGQMVVVRHFVFSKLGICSFDQNYCHILRYRIKFCENRTIAAGVMAENDVFDTASVR